MVRVELVAGADEVVLTARGHAQWAALGTDVVCAGVSVLLQTLWLGVTEVLELEVNGGFTAGNFELRLSRTQFERAEVAVLVRTVARALETLALQFPKNVQWRVQGAWRTDSHMKPASRPARGSAQLLKSDKRSDEGYV